MTRTVQIAAAVIAFTAAGLQATPAIIGPVELRSGETVEIDVHNPSGQTSYGGLDLIDAVDGRVLDRVAFSVAGGRGETVRFSGSRAFVGTPASRPTSDGAVVVGVLWNGVDAPPLTAGEPRRVEGDQKTIIGGFKSLSGMDSETEVIKQQTVSAPFQISGQATIRTSALAGDGMSLVELVGIRDGAVAASMAVQPGDVAVQPLREVPAGAYVLRVTALSGVLYSAVSVENNRIVGSIGCQTMPPSNGVAIETLQLAHEGFDVEQQAAHEVTHVLQGDGGLR